MFYLPVIFLFLIFYFVVLGGLFFLLKIGLISLAFHRLGLSPDAVFLLLLFSLLGSGINIPIKKVHAESLLEEQIVDFFGWKFQVPTARQAKATILAVNFGGAIIPAAVSLYLIFRWWSLSFYFLAAIILVTFFVNRVARPVKGLGIATPALFPPIVAALVSLALGLFIPSGMAAVPALAYVSGTLGTLIGADLMNLNKISGLGAPVASIGGAGTFDGVFLTGILAVILTSL
ncbi:MAG TPA: DUF1614 domain-containing protein [Candidatus Aminicenantes bacterium]|nr:MAG: hypothetical protein C0168_07690 [Candidatus Aminicenantes bacterium]HEK86512.1 DUF1614 domain-containing protein [Candidatus Aminicenantes bacterium]